ncbi:hypothetical protein BH11PSE11_BH11PSE11_04080 [soil metagenome]
MMTMQLRKNFLAVTFGVFATVISHAALAEVVTKPADGVSKVIFKTTGDLAVRVGSEEKLTIEAEPKVLAQLDIGIKNGTMTLASKGSFKTDKPLKFTLVIKSLQTLKGDGSGNVVIEGFSGNDIDVDEAGSGNIELKNIKPGKLTLLLSGSGNIEAAGSGKSVTARIGGSGNIDTLKFKAQVVEARIDGSGDIKVHADETLKAVISGAGNIGVKGKAKVTESISGAGSIDRI